MKITLAQFSQAVALIHAAGTEPERWREALAAIMNLVHGSRVSLMDIEAGTNRLLALSHLGHDPAHARLYADHYYAIDPTVDTCLGAASLRSFTVYEEFPKTVRAKDEYFDFATRICDIGDVIGVSTQPAQGQRALLSLQRRTDAPAYDAEEKALIDLLAPHVQMAKRVQVALANAGAAVAEQEAIFSQLATAALIVDHQARIRHLNSAANTLFARYRQVSVHQGRVRFRDAKLNAAFDAAVRLAATERGRSAALPIQFGKERGELLVAPLLPTHGLNKTWQTPLALVVIATAEHDEQSIAWRMQQLYRLTPAEARIAAALAIGHTVDDIARQNHVSDATLRSQLRSIFSKTGTNRQSDLVRIALMGTTFSRQS